MRSTLLLLGVLLLVAAGTTAGVLVGTRSSGRSATLKWTDPTTYDLASAKYVRGHQNFVSCATAKYCVAAEGDGGADLYDGSQWGSLVGAGLQARRITCPAENLCMELTGYRGAAAVLTFRGNVHGLTGVVGPLIDLSCPTASYCAAVSNRGVFTTTDAVHWSSLTPSSAPIHAISCASPSFCMAAGDRAMYPFDGHSWSAGQTVILPPLDGDEVVSMSCPEVTFCAAVDQAGYVMTYDGKSWAQPRSFDRQMASVETQGLVNLHSVRRPAAVSCTATRFCVAIDALGRGVEYDGKTWSRPVAIDADVNLKVGTSLDDISCVSDHFCVAVDSTGSAMIGTR